MKKFLIFILFIFLCQNAFSKPIMEKYLSEGNYTYMINNITDVVYIEYEEYTRNGGKVYFLVPMYNADGSLMTGTEFKKIVSDGNWGYEYW